MNISNLISNYEEAVAMILFVIGFSNLFFQPNLMKKIIGLNIMDTAVYLFLALKGYIEGRKAPIVVDGVTDVDAYINPIPSGLVLTGIVVSVSVSALMLSLTIRLYRRYHTLNLDEITLMIRQQEAEVYHGAHDFPSPENPKAKKNKEQHTKIASAKLEKGLEHRANGRTISPKGRMDSKAIGNDTKPAGGEEE